MRVLLDECLPRKLKLELVGHESSTVPEMGWASQKNSALLSLAAEHFDAFLTVDNNIAYQQNLKNFQIAIVAIVARSNRLADLRPLIPKVLGVLKSIRPGEIVRVGV
jgi:hypothetical protein